MCWTGLGASDAGRSKVLSGQAIAEKWRTRASVDIGHSGPAAQRDDITFQASVWSLAAAERRSVSISRAFFMREVISNSSSFFFVTRSSL